MSDSPGEKEYGYVSGISSDGPDVYVLSPENDDFHRSVSFVFPAATLRIDCTRQWLTNVGVLMQEQGWKHVADALEPKPYSELVSLLERSLPYLRDAARLGSNQQDAERLVGDIASLLDEQGVKA